MITASDACASGEREDTSGATLVQLLTDLGAQIIATKILSDDLDPLTQSLIEFADRDDVNLIITTGGTGLGPRDNTPEATQRIIEREAPGIAEALLATALGLVAAIPAVIIYNHFARVTKGYLELVNRASGAAGRLLSRDLDRTHVSSGQRGRGAAE